MISTHALPPFRSMTPFMAESGTQLTTVNSPMVIVWPNSDGTFTMSQRIATSYSPPAGRSRYMSARYFYQLLMFLPYHVTFGVCMINQLYGEPSLCNKLLDPPYRPPSCRRHFILPGSIYPSSGSPLTIQSSPIPLAQLPSSPLSHSATPQPCQSPSHSPLRLLPLTIPTSSGQ